MLGLVVAEHVFLTHPDLAEGWLSRARASVVRASTLASVAAELGLGQVLRLGKGEELSGGREKPSILADALEATIGAVYLDGGLPAARQLVLRLLAERIDRLPQGPDPTVDPAVHDYKSRLQELVAREEGLVPEYVCDESGPEHEKLFRAVVRVGGAVRGAGEGRNKKAAEQVAAREAFEALSPHAAEPELAALPGTDGPSLVAPD